MPQAFPKQLARTQRFVLGSPRGVTLSDDGSLALFLRSQGPEDPMQCLWALDVRSGRELLVADPTALATTPSADLPPAERARLERARESAGGILSFDSSSDGNRIAFSLGGELFVVDLATDEDGAPRPNPPVHIPTETTVFDPRLDPTAALVGFVGGNDLRIVSISTKTERQLTQSESPSVTWGQAEFIAAEEMQRFRGYWWAPNGQGVLATRADTAPVTDWWISDPFSPGAPPHTIPYPAAGTTNASVELFWIPLDDSPTQIDWSDRGQFEYLAGVDWGTTENGEPVPLITRQNRAQTVVEVLTLDLDDASLSVVRQIAADPWVELVPGSPNLHQGRLYTVEDSVDLDRRVLCVDGQPVSGPDLQIRKLITVDDNGAVVAASTEPTEIGLWRIDVDGMIEPIETTAGVHDAVGFGHTLAITSRRPDELATSVTIRSTSGPGPESANGPASNSDPAPGSGLVFHTEERRIATLAATPVVEPLPHWFGTGDELRSALFLPTDHDGHTPLPVIVDPYGGPHAQRVLKTAAAHVTSQWFADQGFAVVVTDGRGTPGRRPSFEFAVYGDLAGPVLEDQISALDRIAAETGLLDLDRVGIRGWSFGGYLAALAVLRAPDRFHAAVAGAPVTDWQLYDTHYTERYLGHPATNPDHYNQTSLLKSAAKLQRPLIMIHGLADDNVVAAHSLQLSSALLAAGRPHTLLPLAQATHIASDTLIQENKLTLELDFLSTHLGIPCGTPA